MQSVLSHEGELSLEHAFDAFTQMFKDGSYQVKEIGPYRICTSMINAALLNCVLSLKNTSPSESDTKQMLHEVQASQVPHILFHDAASPSLPESFLKDSSVSLAGGFTLVHRQLGEYEPCSHVCRIQTDKELEYFGKIADICFDLPNLSTYQFLRAFPNILHEDYFFKPYLYYIGNQPVGTIALVTSEKLQASGAYWGAVLPEYREQGIATSLLRHTAYEAKQIGFECMVSQCADTSLGIALKEGFTEHGALNAYLISIL